MKETDKIIVTGGTGMIGKALQNFLGKNTLFLSSKECDLRDFQKTTDLFTSYQPKYVFHLAARVGGVVANTKYIGDFYRDNSMINTNVLEASRLCGAQKVISLLSTCIYPDDAPYPLTENKIHDGMPHNSNYAYSFAKRMLDVQSRAYRQQYGCNYITAVPNNLFGKHDNYDLENSHVIPAIIRKVYEAKRDNTEVILWGTGSPLREFTYSNDLARILVFLMKNYDQPSPINVGNTKEISIKQIANTISNIMEYSGEIVWDDSKPDGQLRKPSNGKKLIQCGWEQHMYTDHLTALRQTCLWSENNYHNLRGVK